MAVVDIYSIRTSRENSCKNLKNFSSPLSWKGSASKGAKRPGRFPAIMGRGTRKQTHAESSAMAFHKSKYGDKGENLPCDLNGDVPEVGDDWNDFAWAADDARRFSEHPKLWKQFIDDAARQATAITAD